MIAPVPVTWKSLQRELTAVFARENAIKTANHPQSIRFLYQLVFESDEWGMLTAIPRLVAFYRWLRWSCEARLTQTEVLASVTPFAGLPSSSLHPLPVSYSFAR